MATMSEEHSRLAKLDDEPNRYAGWLRSMRATCIPVDSYRTESAVRFSKGWAELWRLKWSQALESTWHTDERCYFLTLMLEGPPEAERRNVALRQATPYGGRRITLVAPDQTIYSLSSAHGEVRLLRCFIDAAFIESIGSKKPTDEERAQLGAIDLSGSMIEWLMVRMCREISNAEIGMAIAVESIACELAVEIVRTIEQGRRRNARQSSGGLPPWRMRLLLERIYDEGPLPKIDELADICGMTARHLRRAFQVETGRTLGKFIDLAMAERAGKMLEDGISVGSVAASLGYASSSSFAFAFHRETGLLPSGVRGHRALQQPN
jgi:AraC family transcriptional regulator